jgi:hypothetical protein
MLVAIRRIMATLQDLITLIGIPAIVVTLIFIGGRLEVLKSLKETVGDLKKTIDKMYERFVRVEERVNTLWKDEVAPAHSPRQLNAIGQNILNGSGIKEIIEAKKTELLAKVRALNPTNAYDAEQYALNVVSELPKHCPDVTLKLKEGAFKVGSGVETVLLVGGFYLRDLIFPELGFPLTDLDKPKAAVKP